MNFWSREKWETSFWDKKIPVSAHVSRIDLLTHLPAYIGPGFFRKYQEFSVRHRAISHPPKPCFNEDTSLPTIEITIDCAAKDAKLITKIIEYAELNVLNPIASIKVVVPSSDFEIIYSLIGEKSFRAQIIVLDEDTILDNELRQRIKRLYPNRYGWMIHQFLTLQQVLNSTSKGILSIDADTLILRPMAFMNNSGVQILMESLEYNKPYYEFLNKISTKYPVESPSHITHYSFFQKELLLGILDQLGIVNLIQIVDFIEMYADLNSLSPICIDRELYALGLIAFYPDTYTLVKFANVSVSLEEILDPKKVEAFSEKYNSISAHSYLQTQV